MAWVIGAVVSALVVVSVVQGYLSDPWAPFWLSGQTTFKVGPQAGWQFTGELDPTLPTRSDRVTDSQRYQLARTAGFDPETAVIAVAVSIAENGSGDPTEVSSTDDVGIWQINKVWWNQFGGKEALYDPLRNAQAAFHIYRTSGWCAWYTYERSCSSKHHGTYRQFLERAARGVAGAASPEGPLRGDISALMTAINPWLQRPTPYLFGGSTLSGVDCSAFTQLTARAIGFNLPRTAQEQYDVTARVTDPQPGDLVFFERTYNAGTRITHVGWYVGDGMMISASEPRVGRQSLTDPFWRSRLVGYGRIRSAPGNQA